MYYVVYESVERGRVRIPCSTREEAMQAYRSRLGEMMYGYIADAEAEESGIGTECMNAAAEQLERIDDYVNALSEEPTINWDLLL